MGWPGAQVLNTESSGAVDALMDALRVGTADTETPESLVSYLGPLGLRFQARDCRAQFRQRSWSLSPCCDDLGIWVTDSKLQA